MDCISEINNTQVDNSKDLGFVMRLYNLIECNNNYSKLCGSLWHITDICQVKQIILL